MKSKPHHSYSIKVIEQPFDNGWFSLPQTAVIIFRDANRNVVKKEKYGVLEKEEIYKKIAAGEDINISNCYVKNFSLNECRSVHSLPKEEGLPLLNFSAIRTFFEADDTTDWEFGKCNQVRHASAFFCELGDWNSRSNSNK